MEQQARGCETLKPSDAIPCVRVSEVSVPQWGRQVPRLLEWLSPEEAVRAGRFFREVDRQRYILGRALIRGVCGRHLGIAPREVCLEETAAGKPLLAGQTPEPGARLEFNVSHSGDCVLGAWSLGSPVGIDVESCHRTLSVSFQDMAGTAFSAEEREVLKAAGDDEAMARIFFRIWVRKEAIIKAEGCGIGGPLQGFSVVRQEKAGAAAWAESVPFPGSDCVWELVDLACMAGHVAALAKPQEGSVELCAPEEAGLLD